MPHLGDCSLRFPTSTLAPLDGPVRHTMNSGAAHGQWTVAHSARSRFGPVSRSSTRTGLPRKSSSAVWPQRKRTNRSLLTARVAVVAHYELGVGSRVATRILIKLCTRRVVAGRLHLEYPQTSCADVRHHQPHFPSSFNTPLHMMPRQVDQAKLPANHNLRWSF